MSLSTQIHDHAAHTHHRAVSKVNSAKSSSEKKIGSSKTKVVWIFLNLILPFGLVWQTLHKAWAAHSWYYNPTAQNTSQKKKSQWHNTEKHCCLQRELNGRDEIQLRYLNIIPFSSCNPHPHWLQTFQFVQKWNTFHAAAHYFSFLSSRRGAL